MTPHRAVVAVGANLDPDRHIASARARVEAEHRLLAASPLETTSPIGRPDQPPYRNGAWLVETRMEQPAFRAWLREVETAEGRVRTADRYAPRTLDLDLVAWDGEILDMDVHRRDFLRRAVRAVWPEAPL